MICSQYRLIKPYVIETAFKNIDVNDSGHFVVKPLKMSVCKADMRYFFGMRDANVLKERLPMVLIHEACGEVLYDSRKIFKSGDKVVLLPNIGGKDEFYDENYRLDSKFRSSRADGFMQEAISLRHKYAVKYPDRLNDDVMAFTEFISVGVHAAESFEKISHSRRDRIGVWGDGALAYVICCVLRNKFPKTKISVIGVNPAKLQYFTFVDETLMADQVGNKPKFDHAFECVGGNPSGSAINQMIDVIDPQGTIMLLGVSEENVPINTRMVLEKGLMLLGRSRSQREDFERAVSMLENDNVFLQRMKHLISEKIDVRSIDDINRAFNTAQTAYFKVIMDWNI